jgi:hypothetical protein
LKISDIELPESLEAEGLWVRNIPELPGVALRVRRLWNADHRRIYTKLVDAVPQAQRIEGRLDPATEDEITGQCLAEAVLTGWSGFEGADDKPLAFSKSQAKVFLTDPRYVRIRRGVLWAAGQVEDRGRENLEADAGN